MKASARRCPALLVSAPASGQGKTTVTAALARRARRQGRRVRVFKTGPDFIDPMLLQRASGAPVYQLDLWMGGEAHCRSLLHEAAGQADLILIEGVMGLYDGQPSSADLAALFGVPVLAVIDGSAMAQTFGALAYGLSRYHENLPFHGVLANRVGNEYHAALLAQSLPAGLRFAGTLPPDAALALPERHLGLVQADEIADLETRLDRAAQALGEAADLAGLAPITFGPEAGEALPRSLAGVRIAVARDAAFSFIYQANLDVLQQLGAQLSFFSPLAEAALPEADALYLPGGYPELHAAQFAANRSLHQALRRHHAAGKPIVAECGGMMALFEDLTDVQGRRHAMAGLLPGGTAMQDSLQALALQAAELPGGALRGHGFHYSRLNTPLRPALHAQTQDGGTGEAIFREGGLTASYLHFYFPSNPRAVAPLFLR
jgi:cobyrinic acid a,c-diamide synthase